MKTINDFLIDDREDFAAKVKIICAMSDEEFENYLENLRREEWRNGLNFSPEQIEFIESLNIKVKSFAHLSDEELNIIEEKVSDYLQRHGFDEAYAPNDVGLLCESIIDILTYTDYEEK